MENGLEHRSLQLRGIYMYKLDAQIGELTHSFRIVIGVGRGVQVAPQMSCFPNV